MLSLFKFKWRKNHACIADDGTVYGIGGGSPFKLSDSISNMISAAYTPQIEPAIVLPSIDNKTIIEIDIPARKFRPYYLKNKGKESSTYIRINGTSRVADEIKLKELELEGKKISFDSMREIGKDYSEEKALALCKKMKQIALNAFTDDETNSVKELSIEKLVDFGILSKINNHFYPTYSFNLLTDNTIRYAKIQCALFKGNNRDVFIDHKEFDGPIYEQVDDAYNFVLRHINMGATINGLFREDTYELPISAIREMIANAVLHRSYLDQSCIQVSIFDNRIEVSSPGSLFGGLDIKTMKIGKSTCRNEAIAEAFHYMKIAEAWGTGIPRIISKCNEYNLPNPEFEEFGEGFKVTLYRKVSSEVEKVSSEVEKVSSEIFVIYYDQLSYANVSDKFISNIQVVFSSFENCTFSQKDIQELLNCSKSKATNIMNAMKKAQIITKVEHQGYGKYKFINK